MLLCFSFGAKRELVSNLFDVLVCKSTIMTSIHLKLNIIKTYEKYIFSVFYTKFKNLYLDKNYFY